MGVMWHSGRLSVAYYDIDLTVIYMMLDAVESEEFKLLNRGMDLMTVPGLKFTKQCEELPYDFL